MAQAAPVGIQPFFLAKFDLTSIFVMAPIAIAAMMEHIGDMSAISATVGRNFIEDPGLHRTLVGDGIATALAGSSAAPPTPPTARTPAYWCSPGCTTPKWSAWPPSMR